MAHPNTYLYTAPKDIDNEFGRVISSAALIKGLRHLDPRFTMPASAGYVYVSAKPVDGITGLWHGSPYAGGRYICGLHEGMIPEYTMLEKNSGKVFKRGWRAIFEKIIQTKLLAREAIEREFNVTLIYDKTSGMCRDCQRRGYKVAATCMNLYCDECFNDRMMVAAAEEQKKEVRYLREHPEPVHAERISLYLGA